MDYLARKDQSLFDITVQNFGQLDNIVEVMKDNLISISESLTVDQSLIINNENKGNKDIKNTVIEDNLTFNNKYE